MPRILQPIKFFKKGEDPRQANAGKDFRPRPPAADEPDVDELPGAADELLGAVDEPAPKPPSPAKKPRIAKS